MHKLPGFISFIIQLPKRFQACCTHFNGKFDKLFFPIDLVSERKKFYSYFLLKTKKKILVSNTRIFINCFIQTQYYISVL